MAPLPPSLLSTFFVEPVAQNTIYEISRIVDSQSSWWGGGALLSMPGTIAGGDDAVCRSFELLNLASAGPPEIADPPGCNIGLDNLEKPIQIRPVKRATVSE